MVFRPPYRPRTHNRSHVSIWQNHMQKFFDYVASTNPIPTRDWIRDIRQLINSARHSAIAGYDLLYEWPVDGNIYEYSLKMHESFQKLLNKLRGYNRRGIRFVASDVVNEFFQNQEL